MMVYTNQIKTEKILIYLLVGLLFIAFVSAEKELLNIPCKLDKECVGGFCDLTTHRCTKGLNFEISLSKPYLSVGDEGKISLSVSNPFDKNIYADITLSFGDGVELTTVEYGDQCVGSQCKLDRTKIPASGKKDIIISLKGISGATSFVKAYLNYQISGRTIEIEDVKPLVIQQCGNGVVEEGETSETCCIDAGCPEDVFLYKYDCNKKTYSCKKRLSSVVFLIFAVIFILIGVSVIKHFHKKPFKKKYTYHRTGRAWSRDERSRLKYQFLHGKSIEEIAESHKREPDAIMHQLINSGLIGFAVTRGKYKRNGRRWDAKEEQQLKREYPNNKNVLKLANIHKREPDSILHRLIQLGLIDDKELMHYKRRKQR